MNLEQVIQADLYKIAKNDLPYIMSKKNQRGKPDNIQRTLLCSLHIVYMVKWRSRKNSRKVGLGLEKTLDLSAKNSNTILKMKIIIGSWAGGQIKQSVLNGMCKRKLQPGVGTGAPCQYFWVLDRKTWTWFAAIAMQKQKTMKSVAQEKSELATH